MTIHPTADTNVWKPYREGCRDESFNATFPGVPGAQLFQAHWWDGGLLTDFLILQQVDTGGPEAPEWTEIVRVDCCHNEVHVHRLYADHPDAVYRVIRSIATPEDLSQGMMEAEEVVYDDFEEHLRRWQHGRKA